MFGFLNQNLGCHLNPSLPGEMMALIPPPPPYLTISQSAGQDSKKGCEACANGSQANSPTLPSSLNHPG